MHPAELTAPEQRVLGCLIEKRWTTPDQYPLSVNALRLACNQSTNRDPVTAYDETTVRDAAQRLCRYGLARLASGHTSRSIKYRHLAEEALGLDRQALALLGVLLLRGPQTPGELKGRSERMARFDSLVEVERVLGLLAERGYVRSLGSAPRPEGGPVHAPPRCREGGASPAQVTRRSGVGCARRRAPDHARRCAPDHARRCALVHARPRAPDPARRCALEHAHRPDAQPGGPGRRVGRRGRSAARGAPRVA